MIYLQGKITDFFDMKRRVAGKFILCFLFNCLGVISLNVVAQEMVKPIQGTILLSGNFGELRATHFHSGIDIRTGGVEGLPVVCVKDGRLVRVSVSPTGYGQALYIEHADGTTTVYGHLQRFVPRIAEIVRELQYRQESFRVDQDFRGYRLFFRQGDTIAYSGNTGSSGGPHLHFEIRDTKSEHTLNPLHYYRIRDNKPPVVRMLHVYAISEGGEVEWIRSLPLKALAPGKYSGGRVVLPAGKIGLGAYVTDYMNDSWNKLGVYRLSLCVGKDTLYRLSMDSCSFDQGCFINEIKDFDRYRKKETVYRCFGNYQERFLAGSCPNKGYIEVVQDSLLSVRMLFEDINGNKSTVDLGIQGGTPRKNLRDEVELLAYDQAHVLTIGNCTVELEPEALFYSVRKTLRLEVDSLSEQDIFVLSEKDVPLFKKARLFIAGAFDRQAVICEVERGGRKYPQETRRTAEGLVTEIGYLSRYMVVEDTVAPVIKYLGKFPDRTLRFRVKDDLSGISGWRGEVNGKWCLFSYDPRVNILQCSLEEPPFQGGKVNEVRITVEDKVGNRREVTIKVKL